MHLISDHLQENHSAKRLSSTCMNTPAQASHSTRILEDKSPQRDRIIWARIERIRSAAGKSQLYDSFDYKPLCAGVSAIIADLASSCVKAPLEDFCVQTSYYVE